jgi:hypothetical protein
MNLIPDRLEKRQRAWFRGPAAVPMSPPRLRSTIVLKNPPKAILIISSSPHTHTLSLENETVEETPTQPVEDKPLTEEQIEAATTGMTDAQKRLFKIKLKINQGRKANKEEVEREFKRLSDPSFKRREYAAQRSENSIDEAQASGPRLSALSLSDSSRLGGRRSEPYLGETAEVSEKRQQKADRKEFNRATFGWEAFTVEAGYKSYSKKLGLSAPLLVPSFTHSIHRSPPSSSCHSRYSLF